MFIIVSLCNYYYFVSFKYKDCIIYVDFAVLRTYFVDKGKKLVYNLLVNLITKENVLCLKIVTSSQ